MTRLILIRHGETDYTLQKRYCGFSDPPLNNRGREQAKALAGRFKADRIDVVYSSDLERALRTAEKVFAGRSVRRSANFREVNFGIFEGMKYEEIVEKYPELYNRWLENPAECKIPRGETLKVLEERVNAGLLSILSKHEGKIVAVVTHCGPIRVVLSGIMGLAPSKFWDISQRTAAVNIIDFAEGAAPAVVKINDISHLFSVKGAVS
ncbi:MAG: histidine phosphatase family protein [Candidatus Omnitrophota bacterium]